jgi:endonuclease/exonuclease/phosphatase family metal-dependent hydrolase
LEIYRREIEREYVARPFERSPWETALSLIENEWRLLVSRVRASRIQLVLWRLLKKTHILEGIRRMRKLLNRSEWSVRLLGLPTFDKVEDSPALVLIQIDGLSRVQLERALERGQMPFVRRLLKVNHYNLGTLYSGLPSTTPAVQGELMYGRKASVPAFGFCRRDKHQCFTMTNPAVAAEIEKNLASNSMPLLSGGSCYATIFTGGAAEAHFSPAAVGWQGLFTPAPVAMKIVVVGLHLWVLLRTLALFVLELFLAFADVIGGLFTGQPLLKELLFVPSRLAVTIILRELVTAGALFDITRGVPVIHLNFLGYDEQAHRRGPGSYFALWSLKGIDFAIKRIWRAAARAHRRAYQVWIYSDHGQEAVKPYPAVHQTTLVQKVCEVLGVPESAVISHEHGTELMRARLVGGGRLQTLFRVPSDLSRIASSDEIMIAAVGPLGHIYLPGSVGFKELRKIAERLVREAAIPAVFFKTPDGRVEFAIPLGTFRLPEQGELLFDRGLAYYQDLVEDLIALICSPHSGDLLISGWRKDSVPTSFVNENGAHGGPGRFETGAFVLVPESCALNLDGGYCRPLDLRHAALLYLERPLDAIQRSPAVLGRNGSSIRVMTYNTHGCLGTDGRLSVRRIARVIERFNPDVVCLQELDVGRERSGLVDQAREIGRWLKMDAYFTPALQVSEEMYGNAVLSRYPLKIIKASPLPGLPGKPGFEQRALMWARLIINGREVDIFNTHLGLNAREREIQVHELLSENWLNHPSCSSAVICCGDFNSSRRSHAYQRMTEALDDAQKLAPHASRRPSWPAHFPLLTLDYVFVSRGLQVKSVHIPGQQLVKEASDHLPVICELILV